MDAVGLGHVGPVEHHVDVRADDAYRCFQFVADIVGKHPLRAVFLFCCFKGDDMFALTPYVGLHPGIVDRYDLARYVAYFVRGKVAHRYEIAVFSGAPGEIVEQPYVFGLMCRDDICHDGASDSGSDDNEPERQIRFQAVFDVGVEWQI